MVLLFVGFTIRYLYEYRKYLLDIYYIQNISMCRNTEKKCMHYENGIKDEKNIWKNLSLTWHNQGREEGRAEGKAEGRASEIYIIRNQIEQVHRTPEETAELLVLEPEYIKKVAELLEEYPEETDVQIAARILKAGVCE